MKRIKSSFLLASLLLLPFQTLANTPSTTYQKAETHRLTATDELTFDAARMLYQQACQQGHAKACWRFAQQVNWPPFRKVPQNEAKQAEQANQKACKGGVSDACTTIAQQIQQQAKTSRDKRKAHKLMKQACKKGSGAACYQLYKRRKAKWNRRKRRTVSLQRAWWRERKKHLKRISTLLQTQCRNKNETGCYLLGYLHFQGELSKGRKHATKLFKQACTLGHTDGCDFVALIVGNGLGVTKDLKQARVFHKRACDRMLPDGCNHLAGLYFRGLGGKQDLRKARRLFKRTCGWSHGHACLLLGEMMIRGEGGKRDVKGTLAVFKKSCELKHPEGCKRYRALKPILESKPASKKPSKRQ
jgi:TPR repeat protein